MAKSRRAIAQELLELQSKVAPDLLKIDGCKDALRAICDEEGESFTEEVEGLGSVEVKAGRAKEFKGREPKLLGETFIGLTASKQEKLVEQGLVEWVNLYSKAASPSVTVRL